MAPQGDSTCVIRMSGLSARGRHGVLPQEQAEGQTFSADIAVGVRTPNRDDIATTPDYRAFSRCVIDRIGGAPVQLIETLAQNILADLLQIDGVLWAKVRVHKPQAPLGVPFTDLSVSIHGCNPTSSTPTPVAQGCIEPVFHSSDDPHPSSCPTKKRGNDD